MNNQIKIGIVVVALVGALLLIVFRSSPEDAPLDTPETSTQWMCRMCQHQFDLTASAYEDALSSAGGQPPLRCTSCKEKEAYQVAKCQQCGTFYFGPDVPGGTGQCPKCFPMQSQTEIATGGQQAGPDNTIVVDPDLTRTGGEKKNVIIE